MIDEKMMENNLKSITFPRLPGTTAELTAAKYIEDKIRELNIKPNMQIFSFSKFYPRIYKIIAFLMIFWICFIFFISDVIFLNLINLVISSIILIPLILLTRVPENIKIGKTYRSQNIYVKLESKDSIKDNNNQNKAQSNSNQIQHILFLSHIDSKSQMLPIKLRILSVKLWIYSLILNILMLIIKYVGFTGIIVQMILLIGIISNFIGTCLIISNKTTNKSNGALDNASGVVSVLELLHHYSKIQNRPQNIDLWFIFTGCEENGTMGIRHFYNIIKSLDKNRLRYFNFDSIGKKLTVFGPIKRKAKKDRFINKFFKIIKIINPEFVLKRFLIAVNRSDGYYLKVKKCHGVGFGDKSSYVYIHSDKDTIDKVDTKFLSDICSLIIKFIKEYENNPNIK